MYHVDLVVSTRSEGGDLTFLQIAVDTEAVYSPDASGDDAGFVSKVDECEVVLCVWLFQRLQQFLVVTRCGRREARTYEISSLAVHFA